jgi:hypothetical protein
MDFMKLPSEYIAMLEVHCEKLQEIENWLYEQWKTTGDKDFADSWLQAQQQLRLTAQELLKQPAARSERTETVKAAEIKQRMPKAQAASPAAILAQVRAAAAAAEKS